MKPVLLLPLLVAPALAGCGAPGAHARCPEEFPLAFRGYPAVNLQDTTYELQSTLWNCTDRPIPLDEPCGGSEGIVPRLVVDNVTYYAAPLAMGERALVPRDSLACAGYLAPTPTAQPGYWAEARYLWDGTYRPGGGPAAALPDGTYAFTVEAGPYRQSVEVTLPWPGRA